MKLQHGRTLNFVASGPTKEEQVFQICICNTRVVKQISMENSPLWNPFSALKRSLPTQVIGPQYRHGHFSDLLVKYDEAERLPPLANQKFVGDADAVTMQLELT